MRSYRQYCGLARALDMVGDRWTLLIARELLIRGSARYSDLQHGLPGIATNLLATRLAALEKAGLVERTEAPRPVSATVFSLTPRGRELEGVIGAFGRWAAPLMGEMRRGDHVKGHWFALPARLYLKDASPGKKPVTIGIEFEDEPLTLTTKGDGTIVATPGRATHPDLKLAGEPRALMGLLRGKTTVAQARARGVSVVGDVGVLDRVRSAG
jgi:DNA-binding HxlR family transcriptional regulator